MPVTFCPIASGSGGNCAYVGAGDTHILIDAGISGRRVEDGLRELGVDCARVSAVFVTHEHVDHVSGLGILARRYGFTIYATSKTWRYFERHDTLGRLSRERARTLEPGERLSVGCVEVEPFNIPHDSSEPVGYCFYAGGHKIFVGTDIGSVTDEVRRNISGASVVLLESNHDVEMLVNGRYPKKLKERILGERGHLSNASAGRLLAESFSDKLKYIYLGHLSKENNRPLIALDTVSGILSAAGGFANGASLLIADRDGLSEAAVLP
ncbi:MAG: MBL fold metallo-hydrolase [Firmicutes bacterium]|nr:MBL fold metallo-hydrolase [Bacillota bacterium]